MKRSFIILMSALLFFSCSLTETTTDISNPPTDDISLLKSTTYVAEAGDSVYKFTAFLNNFEEKEISNMAMVSFDGLWIAVDNLNDAARFIDLDVKVEDIKGSSKFVNQHVQVYVPIGCKTIFIPEVLPDSEGDYNEPLIVLEGNYPIKGAVKNVVQLKLKLDGDKIIEQVATLIK